MWEDFKKFALKGNVMDLAIAVVIGAAFSKIVTSLVADIITPIIGVLFGGVKFTGLVIKVGAAEIMYGNFIQSVVDFFLIAASIFFVIRLMMKFQRKQEEKVDEGPSIDTKEALLTEIRDLLAQKK
ncbi:large conductance mechanosensitive channel protein MscL [Paenisporosarcina cavernae]|uniref:Large-conductance mechanosensitive channel n=1 Tax=Paenisporosarcina cavernae TaxID=2320858 RepID=A0A385YVA3_9BACL|nr:large conductance mechanosensitive channel protein MscL [Paenisporosarcina cavernae]AYC29492.1 large conductance mechanosensitive channel protein MscL [Paenisporosarcina cavernae]